MAFCPGVLLGGGGALLIWIILLCSAIYQAADGGELGVAMPNFFAQGAVTVVAGRLLTGVGDLGVCLPGIFTQPRRGCLCLVGGLWRWLLMPLSCLAILLVCESVNVL